MSGKGYLVFVYGTLKTKQPNHDYMKNAANGQSTFVTTGKTSEQYPMVTATRYNIPCLLKLPLIGNDVNGEIYDVDDQMLVKLDELEMHPNYYQREEITINGDDGSTYSCWVYFLKNYPDDFLEGRTLLTSFENTGDKPYVKIADRPKTPKAIDDLAYRS